jgi:methylenetetrahydrofolate reductase (NADPH)
VSAPAHRPDAAEVRFEILPLGHSDREAAQLPGAVRLTVTCSPRLGPDHSVAYGAALRALGHSVTVHLAARMVLDDAHLDVLLAAMADAGIDDAFVIGGDADPPEGIFSSAEQLVPVIDRHPQRPTTIGVAGYPEGHPSIDAETLRRSLISKGRHADYVTTQMCFHAAAVRSWILQERRSGMDLPVLIGVPGQVTAARLIEMSARVGVGPSVTFLRKQRGLSDLFGLLRRSAPDRLLRAVMPLLDEPELGIGGLHLFTFNQLEATYRWQRSVAPQTAGKRRLGAVPPVSRHPRGA